MDPIRLIELRGILADIFRIVEIMGRGEVGLVVYHWFLVGRLSGKRILSDFYFVYVPILLLFAGTSLTVVVLKLLRGRESR